MTPTLNTKIAKGTEKGKRTLRLKRGINGEKRGRPVGSLGTRMRETVGAKV